MSKIIYTHTKFRMSIGKKEKGYIKKMGVVGVGYVSLCRFV